MTFGELCCALALGVILLVLWVKDLKQRGDWDKKIKPLLQTIVEIGQLLWEEFRAWASEKARAHPREVGRIIHMKEWIVQKWPALWRQRRRIVALVVAGGITFWCFLPLIVAVFAGEIGTCPVIGDIPLRNIPYVIMAVAISFSGVYKITLEFLGGMPPKPSLTSREYNAIMERLLGVSK